MIDAIVALMLGVVLALFYLLMCVLMTGILSIMNHRVFVLVQSSVPMIFVVGTGGWLVIAVVFLILRYITGLI